MIRFLAKFWKLIPFSLRLRIVRLSQNKFTASVVAIVLNEKGEVLILDHYIRPGASWGLPGGFIEPFENPEKAIARELKEETNLDIEKISLLRVRTLAKHIEILYIADGFGDVKLKSSEIRDYGWFAPDALPDGISQLQARLIRSILIDSNPEFSQGRSRRLQDNENT